MKRAFLPIAALALAVACATSALKGSAPVIVRGPYLQATTPHEAKVCWRTRAPAATVVHLAGHDDVGVSTALETDHVVTLTNLAAATSYAYRLDGDAKDHTLTTAPSPGASFRALAFGDSGDGSDEQMALARRMEHESFDLVLHLGDIVYPNGGDADYDTNFFPQYGRILATHPFFPAIGNHDMHKPEKGEPYKHIFQFEPDNPARSKLYYSFEWGCAKFVSIESYALFKHPGPHMEWLEHELASNDRRWLVLMMHVPLYSTGAHGDSPELQKSLEPLIRKYRVSLVLAGHDHLYERGKKDGWRYIVTGGGGAGLYDVKREHPFTEHTESVYHYVLLDFSKERIAGKMVRLDGSVGDTF